MFWLIIAQGEAKMRQKQEAKLGSAEKTVRDIRRATRRRHSSEEKIRIVLEGLRGEDSIAEPLHATLAPADAVQHRMQMTASHVRAFSGALVIPRLKMLKYPSALFVWQFLNF
jgi:hypothetical protein